MRSKRDVAAARRAFAQWPQYAPDATTPPPGRQYRWHFRHRGSLSVRFGDLRLICLPRRLYSYICEQKVNRVQPNVKRLKPLSAPGGRIYVIMAVERRGAATMGHI